MTQATLEKAGKRIWLRVLAAAVLAWLLPLQLYSQSPGIDAEASTAIESPGGHEHAEEHEQSEADDHDHNLHDDGSGQNATTAESASHDVHESAHDQEHCPEKSDNLLSRIVSYLGRFHPTMVNFPIAMLIGAALAEILFMITGRVFFANAARYCIWIGAVGALTAGTLGWFFGGFHISDSRWILTIHRWLGTTTVAWSVLVLILSERTCRSANTKRTAYRGVLFVGAALVSATGFFGGALIYGIDHYVW